MNYIPVPANTITLARAVNELIRQDRLIGNKLSTIGGGPTVSSVAGRTGDVVLTTADITSGTFADALIAGNVVRTISLATPSVIYNTPITFGVASGAATGTLSLKTQVQNTILSGPSSGADANPTFRTLVANDIPTLTPAKVGLGNVPNTDATNATNIGTGTLADGRLSSNVALLTAAGNQTFTNQLFFTGGFSTATNILNGNLSVPSSATSASATTTAGLLFAGAANVSYRVSFKGNSTAAVTANHSYAHLIVGDQSITEASSGTHALLASMVIKSSTITGAAATVTNTANLYIEAGSSTTVTGDQYSLWALGRARFDHVVALPQFTTTNRDAITPVREGMLIINTTTHKLNFYNGSAWEAVTSA